MESAIIGVPHRDFGEGVVAVIVKEPGYDLSETKVNKLLDGKVASFKQPKRVFIIDALPRNAMGKVQRSILRERYAATFTQ